MLFLPLRNLLRRRLRSALTIAGVMLGTMAYLVIVATAEGLMMESQASIDVLGTDISIMQGGATMPWLSHLAPDEVDRLRSTPYVASVTPVVVGLTSIAPRSRFLVFGIAPDATLLQKARITAGRVFATRANELLLGAFASRRLDIQAGDRVEVMRRTFDVVGVYETGRAILDGGAVVDLQAAREVFNLGDRVSVVFLDLARPEMMEQVLGFLARDNPSLEATPSDLFTESFQRLGLIQRYGRRLAVLAFLIAALGVCNTLAMNISERTQEVAMLRAIGWRRSRIGITVVVETMAMIIAGALLSIPLSEIVLRLMHASDSLGVVPPHVPAMELARSVALAVATGFALSLIPLIHALRVDTGRALRAI